MAQKISKGETLLAKAGPGPVAAPWDTPMGPWDSHWDIDFVDFLDFVFMSGGQEAEV